MQSVQLAASEIWVTLIFCVILCLFKNELNQKKITKILMIVCITRLLSDAVSWAFDGVPGLFLGILTRSSNYITFVSNDLISLFFSIFIWNLIKKKGEKPILVIKAYWVLEAITICALTLNLHFGWFYSIDESNLYSRGDYYRLTHIAPIAALFIVLWLLIKYHDRFHKNLKFLGWSYFVLMAGATAYEYTSFGLSLQTYAQTFSALMAFFVGEIELRQDLLFTQQKLEQKNAELKEEEKKAEAALKAKTTFLNSMSHDIRTPMNAIIGFTALAQTHIDNTQQVQNYLAKIDTSSTYLLSLVNDILDMSRIESGNVKLDETSVHIPELLQNLQTMVQGLIISKQQNFRIYTQDLRHEDVIIDKLRLNQILINIVGNAIKFTPVGGDIILRLTEKNGLVSGYTTYEFSIKDTGIGMSSEFLEHVFDIFTREQSSTVNGIQGSGLGMAITKNIVELMGGTIKVESEEGKGSEFTVTLNIRLGSLSMKGKPASYKTKYDYAGMSILLVEDNELNREIASTLLQEAGMKIDCAEDGMEAVNIIKEVPEEQYDLILMDIQMPRMNGYTAAKEIRSLPNNKKATIPIIAMTANAFDEDREKSFECGMNGHIVKPFDMEEIAKTIDQILSNADSVETNKP